MLAWSRSFAELQCAPVLIRTICLCHILSISVLILTRYFAFGHSEACKRYRKATVKALAQFTKQQLEEAVNSGLESLIRNLCEFITEPFYDVLSSDSNDYILIPQKARAYMTTAIFFPGFIFIIFSYFSYFVVVWGFGVWVLDWVFFVGVFS